ncbi:LytR/AlgR family response regulator transcription factor [Pontibacter liquoris]|uniref:LytR/AlgR family response regulator transcription factor n=1 Tax=Pontibacter liquoris TaxID=2905677 RepID=UPI001FA6FBCA|nr:LytTR family DNA-binding domain-containing protein [Pontibacter liquoris]
MRNLLALFRHLPPVPFHSLDALYRVPAAFLVAHALSASGQAATLAERLLTETYFAALALSLCVAPLLLYTACTFPLRRYWAVPGFMALLSGSPFLLRSPKPQAGKNNPAPSAPACRNLWIVHTGTKSIPIPVEHICYIFREGNHNFLRTFERVDYLVPQPLAHIHQQLDKKQFFRVNRRMIIACKACQGFQPAGYGKLELALCLPFHAPVVVSQLKAGAFRKWLQR